MTVQCSFIEYALYAYRLFVTSISAILISLYNYLYLCTSCEQAKKTTKYRNWQEVETCLYFISAGEMYTFSSMCLQFNCVKYGCYLTRTHSLLFVDKIRVQIFYFWKKERCICLNTIYSMIKCRTKQPRYSLPPSPIGMKRTT